MLDTWGPRDIFGMCVRSMQLNGERPKQAKNALQVTHLQLPKGVQPTDQCMYFSFAYSITDYGQMGFFPCSDLVK